jgi:hypothetical protein
MLSFSETVGCAQSWRRWPAQEEDFLSIRFISVDICSVRFYPLPHSGVCALEAKKAPVVGFSGK